MLCVSGKVEDELKDCVYYERILNVHAHDGIFGSVRMCTIQLEVFWLIDDFNENLWFMKFSQAWKYYIEIPLKNVETFREIFKKFPMKLYVRIS